MSEKKPKEELYNLKLHQSCIIEDQGLWIEALRVPGGWLYYFVDKGHNLLTSSFVSFDNEFMDTKP